MEITEVKVFPIHEEKLRAFVSIVFDHCFMVNDIKVIQGRDGLFISMPSRKKKNGEFKDIAHPLNNEARRTIEDRILAAFGQITDSGAAASPRPSAVNGGNGEDRRGVHWAPELSQPPFGGAVEMRSERVEIAAMAAINAVPEPKAPEAKTLEELEELHFSDSFWSVE
jgi:stage V sporulation protein G